MQHRKPSKPRKVKCLLCGTSFITRHSQGKYCSRHCKEEANRSSWRLYSHRNREKRRAYWRSFYLKNRNVVIEKTREYQKSNAGRIASKNNGSIQLAKFPERLFARGVVGVAIRVGYLIPLPCEKCGSKKVEGHHDDYLEPFKIRWLCRKDHMKQHKIKSEVKQTV